MTGWSWAIAAVAGLGVGLLVVPSGVPRRFPEDDASWSPRPTRVELPRRPPARSARAERPLADLASCCDLLAVASASGCTVAEAVLAVGSVATGPVGAALGVAAAEVRDGVRLGEALAPIGHRLGVAVQPLLTTLMTASADGAPAGPALVRLADAERRRERRRVEARVRRLPVLLLLPLVGFVLPAFVVLTLVPVGLSAARGGGFVASTPTGVAIASPPRAHPSSGGSP